MTVSAAVSEKANIWKSGTLKNSILIFDKIYVPFGDENLKLLEFDLLGTDVTPEEVGYLMQKGVVIDNPVSQSKMIEEALAKLTEYIKNENLELGGENKRRVFGAFLERVGAAHINESLGELAVPVSSYAYGRGLPMPQNQHGKEIMSLVIDHFPSIHNDVPFDEVLSFRQEHKMLYNDLLRWVGKASRSEYEPIELREELSYLINQFLCFQKIADLKFRPSSAEIFFITAGAVKDLMLLKPQKVANTIASFRSKKADLLQAELNNPGRPLAFVVKAQQEFK
ncbi:hypothetical protein [Vreelandella titanicae]|uniref:Uncharacterized protein n=1 Tax=Vreelandella titanicae TaxID=664683 RepID=A0A558JBZ4_9GAMM|nr:hypothetical protein [Halomonas titanicae]TVU91032.1 hypothetical protein FQP89_08100 [Halomonas titanicae]